MNGLNINTGDFVQVVVRVWTETESPSIENFYEGKIEKVIERAQNCFYVKIEGLDRLIPVDRVKALPNNVLDFRSKLGITEESLRIEREYEMKAIAHVERDGFCQNNCLMCGTVSDRMRDWADAA